MTKFSDLQLFRRWGVAPALLLLALLPACRAISTTTDTAQTTVLLSTPLSAPGVYVGEVVDPPVQLQDFTLPSSTGELMSLNDLNGKWRMMFFGYLHCPDFCPLTLVEYRQVKQLLGDDAGRVAFLYVSVDGVRDTPQALHDYLDNFDPAFIGFSGDDETLARIQPDYGFYYSRRLDSGSEAVYTIDHSTRSYLIDPDGWLRATFTYNTEPEVIAEALQWYLQAG